MAVDDVNVGVVTVKLGQVEVEMVDSYVRGLAWSGSDTLWSAGWDHKVVSHQV